MSCSGKRFHLADQAVCVWVALLSHTTSQSHRMVVAGGHKLRFALGSWLYAES